MFCSVVHTIQPYRQSWAMFFFCYCLVRRVSRYSRFLILSGEFSRPIWLAKIGLNQSLQHRIRIWSIFHFYSFWRCSIYSLRSFIAQKVAISWRLTKPIWIQNRYFSKKNRISRIIPLIVSGSATNLRRRYGKWKTISNWADHPIWSSKCWYESRSSSSNHWVQVKLKKKL